MHGHKRKRDGRAMFIVLIFFVLSPFFPRTKKKRRRVVRKKKQLDRRPCQKKKGSRASFSPNSRLRAWATLFLIACCRRTLLPSRLPVALTRSSPRPAWVARRRRRSSRAGGARRFCNRNRDDSHGVSLVRSYLPSVLSASV